MSGVPRLGFDVVVDKILAIHRDVGHVHDSAQGAVRSVSRQLKSSFVDAGGKRAIAAEVSDETPAPKRRRPAAVTPSVSSLRLSLSTPLPPDSINTRDWGGVFGPSNSGAMLINQRNSVVPHHSAHRSSVLQRIYKHLPPHEVVRLSPGDEIIVVLPAISSKLSEKAHPIVGQYRRAFSRVSFEDNCCSAVLQRHRKYLVQKPNANLEEGFQKLHEIIVWFISLIMTFVIRHVKMCPVSIEHCPRFAIVVS